jgi:hypothetical protein
MGLRVSYKKKVFGKSNFFASLKSLKKRIGSGSVSQRCGSGPTPNVTDPQHFHNSDCALPNANPFLSTVVR